MDKPTTCTIEYYRYLEVAAYVSKKLGYDIDDVPGGDYREFWHWLIKKRDVHNGKLIYFPEVSEASEEWQKVILEAFWEVLGDVDQVRLSW